MCNSESAPGFQHQDAVTSDIGQTFGDVLMCRKQDGIFQVASLNVGNFEVDDMSKKQMTFSLGLENMMLIAPAFWSMESTHMG